jgi:hypothetical protein
MMLPTLLPRRDRDCAEVAAWYATPSVVESRFAQCVTVYSVAVDFLSFADPVDLLTRGSLNPCFERCHRSKSMHIASG